MVIIMIRNYILFQVYNRQLDHVNSESYHKSISLGIVINQYIQNFDATHRKDGDTGEEIENIFDDIELMINNDETLFKQLLKDYNKLKRENEKLRLKLKMYEN